MKKFIVLIGVVLLLTGCGNEEKQSNEEEKTVQNDVHVKFQNIDVTIVDNQVNLIGEVIASENVFYYIVEQGEEVVIKEQEKQAKGAEEKFEIKIEITDEIKASNEIVLVKLYAKGEDGEIINPNYVPIDMAASE